MNGSHDLARLLIQGVRAPVGVEPLQLFDQPVVLSQEKRVQCDHSQMFIGSGITCEAWIMNKSSTQIWREISLHVLAHQLESRMWCSPGAWICLTPSRWWSFEGHRGPGEPAGGAGTACGPAPGPSAGSWWPLSPVERRGFSEPRPDWWSCRTPCWHPQRRWWRWAAHGGGETGRQRHSWEQSGRKACSSGCRYEDLTKGSERRGFIFVREKPQNKIKSCSNSTSCRLKDKLRRDRKTMHTGLRSSWRWSSPVWGSRACPGCRCGCSQLPSWRRLYWGSEASAPRHGLSTDPTPPAGGTEWSPERCCCCEWTAPPETPAAPGDNRQSVGAPAADRTKDEWALLLDSYRRQSGIMVGVLRVPASGRPPRVLVLRRQPAGIRDVCSSPSGMFSRQDKICDCMFLCVSTRVSIVFYFCFQFILV